MHELDEEDIQSLYTWIDSIQLSRPKKNITRDFSDGVACAEVVKYFIPKLVDLHNYSQANSVSQKVYNWTALNQKVFRRLGYSTNEDIIQCIVANKPGYVEYLLYELRQKIDSYLERESNKSGRSSESGLMLHGSQFSGSTYRDTNTSGSIQPRNLIQSGTLKNRTPSIKNLHKRNSGANINEHSASLKDISQLSVMGDSSQLQGQIWSEQSQNVSYAPTTARFHESMNEYQAAQASSDRYQASNPLYVPHRSQSGINEHQTALKPLLNSQNHQQHYNLQTQQSNMGYPVDPNMSFSCDPAQQQYLAYPGTLYPLGVQPQRSSERHSQPQLTLDSVGQPTQQLGSNTRLSHPGNPYPTQSEPHENALIFDLQDTVNILQLKVSKLEQLLTLKDQRIQKLQGVGMK
ncbi:hypothetical protein BASA61_006440 [Batrachochytrium salamandrivorans]|nr:hypothetical protein BASA61_006440 [Batrachochytrium salamandrivorans]